MGVIKKKKEDSLKVLRVSLDKNTEVVYCYI